MRARPAPRMSGACGGCLCGRTRFALSAAGVAAADVAHCHCRTCQRASGAGAVAWVTVPASELALRGPPLAEFASSATGRRRFCAACGTQLLFADAARMPGLLDVTLASFDAPDAPELAPTAHEHAASARAWVLLDEALRRHEGDPPAMPAATPPGGA